MRVCSTPGCPELVSATGRCPSCQAKADKRRGSAKDRGYTSAGHKHFRAQVLARDPICVLCRAARATEADHWPRDRRELLRLGLNPDNPDYGRGLCHRCHSRETAKHQPGGWAGL